MNEEAIDQIINNIKKSDFSPQEKKDYCKRFEQLKKISFDKKGMQSILEILAQQSKGNPVMIKRFFEGAEEALAAYLEKGGSGLLQKTKELNKKLADHIKKINLPNNAGAAVV